MDDYEPTAEDLEVAGKVLAYFTSSQDAKQKLFDSKGDSIRQVKAGIVSYSKFLDRRIASSKQETAGRLDGNAQRSREKFLRQKDKQALEKCVSRSERLNQLAVLMEPTATGSHPIVDRLQHMTTITPIEGQLRDLTTKAPIVVAGKGTMQETEDGFTEQLTKVQDHLVDYQQKMIEIQSNPSVIGASSHATGAETNANMKDYDYHGQIKRIRVSNDLLAEDNMMQNEVVQLEAVLDGTQAQTTNKSLLSETRTDPTPTPTQTDTKSSLHINQQNNQVEKNEEEKEKKEQQPQSQSHSPPDGASSTVLPSQSSGKPQPNPSSQKQSKKQSQKGPSQTKSQSHATPRQQRHHIPPPDLDDPTLFTPLLRLFRNCYICKASYAHLHFHYHNLCPSCATLNYYKRQQNANLTGYIALLTGGRVKIGYSCGLQLLRAGAFVILTSRFPHDTAKRYANEHDFDEWKDRLHIYGLDLRDIATVIHFTEMMKERYKRIDIIINNACQTIRRPVQYYHHLLPMEKLDRTQIPGGETIYGDAHAISFNSRTALLQSSSAASLTSDTDNNSNENDNDNGSDHENTIPHESLSSFQPLDNLTEPRQQKNHEQQTCQIAVTDITNDETPTTIQQLLGSTLQNTQDTQNPHQSQKNKSVNTSGQPLPTAAELSQMKLTNEDALPTPQDGGMYFPLGLFDYSGQQLDLREKTSWVLRMHEVEPGEILETFAINVIAPFIINSRLFDIMVEDGWETVDDNYTTLTKGQSTYIPSRPRFIINVSAMEGKFYRFKNPCHPHTNMAKAALNMLTRTSASYLALFGIYCNSVDTGWIHDENPYLKKQQIQQDIEFHPPLDELDASARILDPIFHAINTGNAEYGAFLKDYGPSEW